MLLLICKGCYSQQPACGKATATRIIGGTDAKPGSWPWQIALKESDFFFCGGSVITNEWILTAAHCFQNYDLSKITVHLGVNNLTGPNPNEVIRMISQVVVHPAYNNVNFDNDMCLLKLSAPVNFTKSISPVCLASQGSTFYSGLSIWVTGFGVTSTGSISNTLQELNVPIVGNNECTCYLQDFSGITGNMMCAGDLAGGKDSCQGDSGGPLVALLDNTWVQAGVVSFGDRCALPLRPGVYARVSEYQDWISATVVSGMRPGFVTYNSTGFDVDSIFMCPTALPTIPPTTTDGSIFGSGENLKHFTHLTALFILVPVLHVLVGGGEM
ncbi:serine protease 27 [Austrofundulus limnaeus]|uniref:Serine protease 27 n=1 Tax=Austrofundulus limnaeus TaxID=52670 RepID=A0A2I4CP34_AUSLI|nr:PREDICTED: serine protease 27-like [Austrofundulus limnaeus]